MTKFPETGAEFDWRQLCVMTDAFGEVSVSIAGKRIPIIPGERREMEIDGDESWFGSGVPVKEQIVIGPDGCGNWLLTYTSPGRTDSGEDVMLEITVTVFQNGEPGFAVDGPYRPTVFHGWILVMIAGGVSLLTLVSMVATLVLRR